jgi:hypothetical protein
MDRLRKWSNSESCTPSSEPFRIFFSGGIGSSCIDPVSGSVSVVNPRLDEQCSGKSDHASEEMG